MSTAQSQVSQYQALYRATVREAAAGGHLLMGKLVAAARLSLQTREAACRDLRERDALAQSAKQLRSWETELCNRYPQALLDAFNNPVAAKKAGTLSSAEVDFDALELMDETQVMTSITLARAQQVAMLAAEASLAELNTLICSTLGLGTVNAERNPLRPLIYINALKAVIEQTKVSSAIQLDWLTAMGTTLGQELRSMYEQMCAALRNQGVVAAGYMVVQTSSGGGVGVGRGVAQDMQDDDGQSVADGPTMPMVLLPQHRSTGPQAGNILHAAAHRAAASAADDTLLTLDKLRRLLAGELDGQQSLSPMEQFAQRFSREFETSPGAVADHPAVPAYDATVPAALEALKEMRQVDAVVQRLQQRRSTVAPVAVAGDTSIEAIRAQLRSESSGVAQSLSLEVITLMVDNIAHDLRLLAPVQQLMRRLEPALLRLALVDQRLFTNKQHPARVLVQEVADRSLAYDSPQSQGFAEFASAIGQAFDLLNREPIESAEPFERVLQVLRGEWQHTDRNSARNRDQAVQALESAERRNLLAQKIAKEIAKHPDAARVPQVIVDFLCGPWAQVVAQARLGGDATKAKSDKYQSLISALLWSVHPDITRKDASKLTRLVPRLLSTLREGLETIHFPFTRTSVFFEALMGLHQRAFRAEHKPVVLVAPLEAPPKAVDSRPLLVDDGNPWVAPEEASASNFIELPVALEDKPESAQPLQDVPLLDDVIGGAAPAVDAGVTPVQPELEMGCWVELWANDRWSRTQLTWASPHGTLFLFTSAAGATQSMTRRSREKLLAAGQMRVLSGQPLVDGALNVVAQMAMRNSVNSMS